MNIFEYSCNFQYKYLLGHSFVSKKLIWINSDIHSCNFVSTNIFGHSFVSKFSRMSHSVSVCQSVNQSRSSVQEMLAHLKIAHDFIKMSPYEELVALHCCFYLHSHACSGTVLHILRTYTSFEYYANQINQCLFI